MPWDDAGLTVTPATVRIADLRARIDAALADRGFPPLDYDGTLEGAWTEALAVADFDREEGLRVVQDALSPETAAGANLDRHGQRARIPRLRETASRYTVRAVATGTITYPAGALLTDPAQPSIRWRVVADTEVTTTETQVVIEATTAGPIALDSGTTTTFQQTTAIGGLVSVTYDPADGDTYAIGRYGETDGAYRARLRRLRSTSAGPTYNGIRAQLLAVSFVTAVSLSSPGAGQIAVTVVPAPVGNDQTDELAAAILDACGAGTTLSGASSRSVTLPGGETAVARWTAGATQAVAVVVQVTIATGFEGDVVRDAVEEVIATLFSDLDTGDALSYWRVAREIAAVEGVAGIAMSSNVPQLTLAGTRADVTPVSTTLLVPGTITVT